MQWLIRTVLLLALTSSALAKKSDFWWFFPNFNENGVNNSEISATNVRNGTDGEVATLRSTVDGVFNLSSNIDVDIEYEDKLNGNEGSGNLIFPVEDLKQENKTTSEAISDQNSKDFDWVIDRNWASKENQNATTFTTGDAMEKDNEKEIELGSFSSVENVEIVELSIELTNETENKVVHIDGDAHSSSKLEEEQTNDEDDTFSGDDDDEKAEIDELAQIFKEHDEAAHENGDVHPSSKKELEINLETEDIDDLDFPPDEKDEPVHENGDVHPSSKIELEEINLETEDIDDLDFPPDEKDETVHENGDVHPSSKFEVEENNYNIEEIEDSVDEVSPINSEVVQEEEVMPSNENIDNQDLKSDEEVISSSSEESQENGENPMKENFELLKNDDGNFEVSMEDVLVKDDEKEAEKTLKATQDDEAPIVNETENDDDGDEMESKNKELSPIDYDYEDITLHWINDEQMDTTTVDNKSSEEDLIADIEDTSPLVPIAPIFKTPLCSFDTRPFDLAVLPVNSISGMHGSDVSLLCQLVPHNESERITYFRLTWLFEKEGCQKNASDKNACTSVLTSKNFESSNSSNSLSYGLTKLNHTIHTGVYICDAEIYGCQSQNVNATRTSQALYLRVYTKPNYGLHIGVISSVCVLLLAILAGLVSYARRVQKQSKSRYQELLSSTDIQYYPSKVLELPNSVYNPTTTRFVRMSASTFSSKSSFTSNEEDA